MTEDPHEEIVRKAKRAAILYGRRRVHERHPRKPVHALRLTWHDARLSIFWIPWQQNLRMNLTIPSLGHHGSKVVVSVRDELASWHWTEHNAQILDELNRLLVLDNLADV